MCHSKPEIPDPGPSAGLANEYKHEANHNKGDEKQVQQQDCICSQQKERR
jgi:hypothetical protein